MPKGVFKYSVMPELGSRINSLFMSGFHYIPYFIAVVYQMVGLLDRNHPYLIQSNVGLYGVRHVVFEAAKNIKFSWRNIDQIILFLAVIMGLVIFLVQLLSLGVMLAFQPVMAAMPANWLGFFVVANPAQDLAYMMLDMVFGVPHVNSAGVNMGFFESCVGSAVDICQDNFGTSIADFASAPNNLPGGITGIAGQFGPLTQTAHLYFPFPFHLGMQRLFLVYSNGLLVVAVVITSYFIVTILAETAQTGTPFGKRFNKTWAPLRIVIAFGLLMPFNATGLNSSQYIVLYAAKIGSAFASNGWRYFNTTLTTGYLGANSNLVSTPNAPSLDYLTQFLYVAKSCKVAYEHYRAIQMGVTDLSVLADPAKEQVMMYALTKHSEASNSLLLTNTTSYDGGAGTLIGFLNDGVGSVTIRFGVKNDRYTNDRSSISPVCGEIELTLTDSRDGFNAEPGPYLVQMSIYMIVQGLWHDFPFYVGFAGDPSSTDTSPTNTGVSNRRYMQLVSKNVAGLNFSATDPAILDGVYVNNINNQADSVFRTFIDAAVLTQGSSAWLNPSVIVQNKGWAAAGIWYNKIAEMNGSLISSMYSVPMISRYPAVMEKVAEVKSKYNREVDQKNKYNPSDVSGISGTSKLLDSNTGQEFATTMYAAFASWGSSGITKVEADGNGFLDAISSILGLEGLFDLRKNQTTHPLAMLVGVGRSLVESSIRSLGYAAMATVLSAANIGGQFATISASFFVSIAMMGLTVGFVLFYVVPFLPFIYFFFAVGGWIKGIFEAMVGAPLWALAHIRIDGHGLPGQAAINGYFLIFEVFLRPMLIIFGLLASITIFSALVQVLNSIFSIVTENLGGYDIRTELAAAAPEKTYQFVRSRIDEFFFTVIYAILVYLIGMSSFKMIDNIPNNILRWMGQSVATFGDQREDPAQNLVSKTSVGSQQALSKIGGGLQSLVKGAGTK